MKQYFDYAQQTFKTLFIFLALLMVYSCVPAPSLNTQQQPSTQTQSTQMQVQPANFRVSAGTAPEPEMLTFPSMVTPQLLAAVDKLPKGKHFKLKFVVAKPWTAAKQADDDEPEDEDDKDDDEAGEDEETSKNAKPFKNRIFVPETGNYTVTFLTGIDFTILDGDARDGNATVQMPREVLDGYLKVRGKWSRDANGSLPAVERKLTYEDPLYYVKQDFTRVKTNQKKQGQQKWLHIGNRALPIPTDWRSVDGDKYILKINNAGVTRLVMRWYKTSDKVAYPPGLNEIGPAGGTVELAGVGKLEIPTGAISSSTVVKMTQVLQVASRRSICPPNRFCHDGYEFVSPIVKLEPFLLVLNQPAHLYLTLDQEKIKNFLGYEVRPLAGETLNDPRNWGFEDYLAPLLYIKSIGEATADREILVKKFAYVSKEVPYESPQILNNSSFHIQNTQNSNGSPGDTEHFRIKNRTTKPSSSDLVADTKKYLEDVIYKYYVGLGLTEPPKWDPPDLSQELKKIPVELKDDLSITLPNGKLVIAGIYQLDDSKKPNILGGTLKLSLCSGNSCQFTQFIKETMAHELFHAFQEAKITKDDDLPHFTDDWFMEGSAVYMAAQLLNAKPGDFDIGSYNPSLYDQDPILSQLSYIKNIKNSQNELNKSLIWRSNLLSLLNVNYGNPYTATAFFTHLAHKDQGPITIAKIVTEYDKLLPSSPSSSLSPYVSRSVQATMNALGGQQAFVDAYVSYVQDAALKANISMFTQPIDEVKMSEIQVKSGNIEYPIDGCDEESLENCTPVLPANGIDNLGVKYFLLKANQNLPANVTLTVRLRTQTKGAKNLQMEPDKIDGLGPENFFKPVIIPVQVTNGIISSLANTTFQPVSASGVEITNFGTGANKISTVLVIVPNISWQKVPNRIGATQVSGLLEYFYKAPPPIIHGTVNPPKAGQPLTLLGENFDAQTLTNNTITLSCGTDSFSITPTRITTNTTNAERQDVLINLPANDSGTCKIVEARCTADFTVAQVFDVPPGPTCPVSNYFSLNIEPAGGGGQPKFDLPPEGDVPLDPGSDATLDGEGFTPDTNILLPGVPTPVKPTSITPDPQPNHPNHQKIKFAIPQDVGDGTLDCETGGVHCVPIPIIIRPKIDTIQNEYNINPAKIEAGDTVTIKGAGFGNDQTFKFCTNGLCTTINNDDYYDADNNKNQQKVTLPLNLPPGTHTVQACKTRRNGQPLCSTTQSITVLPTITPSIEITSVGDKTLFANGHETTLVKFKANKLIAGKTYLIYQGINTTSHHPLEAGTIIIKGGQEVPTNSLSAYADIATGSSYPDGSFIYKSPNHPMTPADYHGSPLWKDPLHRALFEMKICDLDNLTNCGITQYAEKNELYFVYTYSATVNYPQTAIADGSRYPVSVSNVKDAAGKDVPGGTFVYLTATYWGQLWSEYGTGANDNGPALLVGGSPAQYITGAMPFGWTPPDRRDCFWAMATRTTKSSDKNTWLRPNDEFYCIETYRPPATNP